MNQLTARRRLLAAPIVVLAITGLTVGCTHEYEITPTFQRSLAGLPKQTVCAQGESLEISVLNQSPNPRDAGQVTGGIHTFNHHFVRDPAQALQEGLTAALQEGHCTFASPAAADLRVVLVNMDAHGEACGFVTCDGTASASVSVTLKDASGQVLSQQVVSTAANDSCGMTFCSEEETSALATRAISEAVGKAMAVIGSGLARRAAPSPVVAARPGS